MKRQSTTEIDSSGYDSFLDVVANLVGILLILIMIVGMRARSAWQQAAADPSLLTTMTPSGRAAAQDHSATQVERKIQEAREELESLKRNVFELDAQAAQTAASVAAKKSERDQLQLVVAAAERGIADIRNQMAPHQQAGFDVAQESEQLQAQLKSLQQEAHAALAAGGEPEIIEHRPTPLAKTVFGREEHFRLLNGCIVHVPLNELVDELKRDAENKIWKLKHVNEITETLPPKEGFRLKYTMQRSQRREMTEAGPVLRTLVELQRFILLPVDDRPGEPTSQALREDSRFRQHVARLSPQDTTITIWTYPDSFTEFRQTRDFLAEQGFLTAGRPLPAGFPIGGSPEGNRSSAE